MVIPFGLNGIISTNKSIEIREWAIINRLLNVHDDTLDLFVYDHNPIVCVYHNHLSLYSHFNMCNLIYFHHRIWNAECANFNEIWNFLKKSERVCEWKEKKISFKFSPELFNTRRRKNRKNKKKKKKMRVWVRTLNHWIKIHEKHEKKKIFRLQIHTKKNWITCRRFEQMWKMIFRFSDWYWEIYIKWMEKAYKKNYHYELKIGIVWRKKKFIHSEFNNSKKEKCLIFLLFYRIFSIHSFIHSASALLVIMMILMLQNVNVYPCRYTYFSYICMSYLSYNQLSIFVQITQSSSIDTMPSYKTSLFSHSDAFYFSFFLFNPIQMTIFHHPFDISISIAVNPVFLL